MNSLHKFTNILIGILKLRSSISKKDSLWMNNTNVTYDEYIQPVVMFFFIVNYLSYLSDYNFVRFTYVISCVNCRPDYSCTKLPSDHNNSLRLLVDQL